MYKARNQKILSKVKNDYNRIAGEFSQTREYGWTEFEQYLRYIKDGDKLVDLGCGNGRFYNFLKDKRKIHYTGIDNSHELVKEAQKKHKVTFIEADILETKLKSHEFNIALMIASLHHIPSPTLQKKTLEETRRILKENGILIVSVWNLEQKKYKKYLTQAKIKSILSFGYLNARDTYIPWSKSGVKRYYHAFKQEELANLIESSGFHIIKQYIENNFIYICRKK